MLTYDVKTYERFFWMLYKDAFKQAVKGFFRADELRRDSYLNYFKYVHAYRVYYSEDSRRNPKWGDFIIKWVNTHTLSVWTSGLVFHYNERPIPEPPTYEALTPAEVVLGSCIRVYDACVTEDSLPKYLALSRWLLNAPIDLYDELALPV